MGQAEDVRPLSHSSQSLVSRMLWERQMKFDSSGITRLRDTKNIVVSNEREVFKVLGLDYIDPILRNAE